MSATRLNRRLRRHHTFSSLPNQEKIVLRHLIAEGTITACEAQLVHRIRSLSRRITTLLDSGVSIVKEDRVDVTGQRYRRYTLEAVPPEMQPDDLPWPGRSQVACSGMVA